jgi:diaminopimelate decarboxylase
LPEDYARLVAEEVGGLGLRLLFEPGRMIAGNAGILVARVLYVKRGASKIFTIVDAGMNDLMRPTLYEAWHEFMPVAETSRNGVEMVADVVGPVCESGDYLAKDRPMPGSGRRRPGGGHDDRGLWRGAVGHLQHPPARPRNPGEGEQVRDRAAAPEL